jgi:monofunctional biosynthetic peptidoglycan transglycosylase
MQSYLNAAEWGGGVFGVQAASQARFKVSAGQLTPHQAALLAAVLPSPNKWSVTNPGPYVRRRAASIEARMYAIHAQGLDKCVLDAKAALPPRPRGKTPDVLAPLPALPADVAAETDAPRIAPDSEAAPQSVDPLMTSSFQDGQTEAAGDGSAPADEPEASVAPPQ